MSKLRSSTTLLSKALGLGALFAALSSAALAQVVISNVTYSTPVDNAGDYSTPKLNYSDFGSVATTVTAGSVTYNLNALSSSSSVYIQRTASAGNYPTLIGFQSNGAGSTYSSQNASLGQLLASGNPYAALLNPFNNGGSSNIERIDAYFGASTTVQATQGLSFFGLALNAGSSFRVALITGWDSASNKPTSYSSQTVLVQVTDPNALPVLSTPDGLSAAYQVSSFGQTDNISGDPLKVISVSGLNLAGFLVRFSDFGLADGSSILGYSVMAGDGTVSSGADLLNPALSNTVYPSNTGLAGGGSGFNFSGFNTAIASPVPEPSTYGLMLTAGSLGFFAWRRRRMNRPLAKV